MISPSERSGQSVVHRDVAIRPTERLMRFGGRSVSRLEFSPLESPDAIVDSALEAKSSEAEIPAHKVAPVVDKEQDAQEEEIVARVERARREGAEEARREGEEKLELRIAEERARILKAGEEFSRERRRYFAGVESEVVKLALAIAARVLHREVKLDPLMLSGVVRVALEKIGEDSTAILRVPASELGAWQGVFAAGQEPSLTVLGEERLAAGECVLETNVGKVELGVSAQLEEVERGFFDLMQQRPT